MPRRTLPHAVCRALAVALALAGLLAACATDGADPADSASGTDGPTTTVGPPTTRAPATNPPTTTAPPTTAPAPDPIRCAAELPDRFVVGQLLVPIGTTTELVRLADAARAGELGGVALLGRPTAAELATVTALDDLGPVPVLVASDEEGGRVQRLGNVLGPLPSAAVAAGLDETERRERYDRYAAGLAEVGVDIVFGPVVDVGGGPGIGDRAFGSDPDVVTAGARTYVDALRGAGVLPTLKHFPGHGRASGDTHLGFATTPPWAEMQAVDVAPYRELIDGGPLAVMVGHLTVPGLTGDLPASLSPAAIEGVLRGELGFAGLVVTDSLTMDAVTDRWRLGEAAVLALDAGSDLVVFAGPGRLPEVRDAVLAALDDGTLAPDRVHAAVVRVLEAKGVDPCALDLVSPG